MGRFVRIKEGKLPQAIMNGFKGLEVDRDLIEFDVNWLIKEIETLREHNLELAVANENLQKEVSVLENKIRTLEKKMFEQRRQ